LAGSVQGLLQVLQCCLLVFVSTHEPPQVVVPATQVHVPPTQLSCGEHFVVQSPQCCSSLAVFTHEPLQLVSEPHVDEHLPELQTSLVAHGFPQEPQFS